MSVAAGSAVAPATGLFGGSGRSGWRVAWGDLVQALVVLGALAAWAQALPSIDAREMDELGLVTVLPAPVFAAFALLAGSFAVALRRSRPSQGLLLLHLLALILVLDATPLVLEGTPGRPDAWRHLGFAEYVLRNGSIDPTLSAYFNWPSFFVLSAFATDIVGNPSAAQVAIVWAPLFFNLAFLGPLLMILRSATRDPRLVWFAAWLFYLGDWVGQDYYAPQAFGYLLYLTLLGILLRWFSSTASTSAAAARSGPAQRLGLLAMALVVFSAVLSGHQLTPFFTLLAVTALVLFRVCWLRGLPVVMAVMIASWLLFVAWAFFSGHVSLVLGSIGRIRDTLDANVTDRLVGSPAHVYVVRIRLTQSVVLWATGFLLAARRFQRGQRDHLAMALLAFTPFSVLGMQGYGGEIVMRVYFFALPPMAFLVGTAFFGAPERRVGWPRTAVLAGLSVVLFGAFLVTRYGDERVNHMTSAEVDVLRYVYGVAPPGSLLVAAGPNTSWEFQNVEQYQYAEFELRSAEDRAAVQHADLDAVERKMRADPSAPMAYLIATRSQRVALEDFAGLSADDLDRFTSALRSSPRFRALYTNADGAVFVLADAPAPEAKPR